MQVTVHIDRNPEPLNGYMAKCPHCGQKLVEVSYIKGVAQERIKCRRCKNFVLIDIT